MDDNLGQVAAEQENFSLFSNQEQPLRTELRGIRRLEEFAAELGRAHKLLPGERGDDSFVKRFEENIRSLRQNYRTLSLLAESGKTLSPSEEWLVDNYYLIAEQIREIREDLPREFYEQLPKLDNFQSKTYLPRIFALAENLVAETDSLLDQDSLTHFIEAYQEAGAALTIGEIWALPIALRLILIDNLRRISASENRARLARQNANKLADEILDSKSADFYIQIARLQKNLDSVAYSTDAAWLVQLIRRLRNQNESFLPLLEMIEKKLRVNDYLVEQIFVHDQNQAARAVVTIGNIINSFRWLNAFDWSGFFERVSRVDEILRMGDPQGVYARMDFQTRDRYRQKIERLARRGKKSEIELAHRVVEFACKASPQNTAEDGQTASSHIGYYLVDEGRKKLEVESGYRPTIREFIERLIKKYPKNFYFSTLSLITALLVLLSSVTIWQSGGSWAWTLLTAVLTIVPAMTLAVSFVNWVATKLLAPSVLPKMNFAAGVPIDARSMIVIPTMFGDLEAVREMIRRLEVHYLSNSDANFYFAILSDFGDAATEETASDQSILDFAQTELAALNARYSGDHQNAAKFHLFHRRRVWSETENKWIGWERKRGKIEEFNSYLRGVETTSLIVATLDRKICQTIKYVITLDADTKLPPGAARKLVGIIAHPLNQPYFAPRTNRLERGYAILQPRVSITAESTSQSVFARIMAGFAGLDPYTTAVSDVYQDLFGAGIYTGKGLYVVDAFERALKNRIPPETILSHDLLESVFARTALVSDVEFFDDFPTIYEAHARRLHRWVRGDWQLLPWLASGIPTANGTKIKNDLSLVSRWKIFDNLAAHLIALKQSLLEKIEAPVFSENLAAGLADGWAEVSSRLKVFEKLIVEQNENFASRISAELKLIRDFPLKISDGLALEVTWEQLSNALEKIRQAAEWQKDQASADGFKNFEAWLDSYVEQIESLRKDANEFFSWRNFVPADDGVNQNSNPLLNLISLSDVSEKLIAIVRDNYSDNAELISEAGQAAECAARAIERLRAQAQTAEELARAMDFRFLINKTQGLFAIGYNVSDNRLDNSCYDLLASEARLASFWAIAKGDAPPAHWFKLGRAETMLSGGRALVSWSGTMFEYLMPLLVMKTFMGTLLDQTYRAVVERQIEYGDLTGVPWGISEAGYNARDLQLNYQYAPFGVPGLGLKRGLGADLVVAPYATALATMVAPEAALENLRRLEKINALGSFGFYESLDFTPERLPENKSFAVVKNYMAHHQGMSFLALGNVLHENIMQERFHRDAAVQAVELLLQERAVQNAPLIEASREDVSSLENRRKLPPAALRVFKSANTASPHIQMLSNRNYSVMVTNSGSGFSTSENLAVTRWREDATTDSWGSFIYLSDARDSSKYWSATYQPIGGRAYNYEAAFTDDRAVFRRTDFGITTQTEIIVSSEDNVEMRQVTLINQTDEAREIFVTSYAEIVLNTAAADAAHPAFSNLFVETEYLESDEAIIARRRPRSVKDREIFGVHVAIVEGRRAGPVEFETDRAKFLGRNRTTANPSAILDGKPLSKTVGAVIDPIFSLRYRLQIPAQSKASVCFSTGIAFSREETLRLTDKYNNPHVFERESAMAWTKARVEQRHLQIKADEAAAFQSVAAKLLFASADFRAANNLVRQNNRVQSNLWAYGVSGDWPILLVKIKTADDLAFVRQMLSGQEYLRLKNLKFDLVILNLHPEGYAQNVQEELNMAVRTGGFQQWLNQPGGVFLLRQNMLPEEDARLFETIARLVFNAESGTVVEQLKIAAPREEIAVKLVPVSAPVKYRDESLRIPPLKLFNGTGGFTEDGREYVISLKNGAKTPAPWINVIANDKDFGFQISESGAGYTWSVNSRENRLTTWTNDAVSDAPAEAYYLRDDETGAVWSPLPAPVRSAKEYVVKHGQGYTQFLHNANGIKHDTIFFVPLDATVKIAVLRIENKSGARRKLSLWNYNELVLGVQREKSAPTVVTAIDTNHQILFAYNRYNNEFANRSAFLATNAKLDSHTCDRREFIGRNGSLENPAALTRRNLLNRCNPKLDPCFATHSNLQLEANEVTTIVFLLGETETDDQARETVQRFRSVEECYRALNAVKTFWDQTLTRVEIKTPDESANLLVNRWLLYQTLGCRVWARSAFYQSGGAFGFRDQLQDVMSLVHTNPEIVKNQILLAAERQFKEGDVQHWWHPPTGRGVRTRISDDLLWLPFVTAHYLKATGDREILKIKLPFLEARELNEGEEDMYLVPHVSDEEAHLFEHCRRAIERSLKFGVHDLPLMGSGDWNDGMNQIGLHGKGESVWLGWFLSAVLQDFAPVCEMFGEKELAEKYLAQAETVRANIEKSAWDGEWYRRAYFDDGTPLGSKINDECKIDAIAQSWSLISGAGDEKRARIALDSVEKHLVRRDEKIILLFDPPFDHGTLEPGYIKGYVPGVRENGGQYAHGALWTIIAYALAGKPDLAAELFAMINPINHSRNEREAALYKNEPYVFTADIHNTSANAGRGGWSWYTGSAGWAYRAVTEFMFGLHKLGDKLLIEPHFPAAWNGAELIYRFNETVFKLRYTFDAAVERTQIVSDGLVLENSEIQLRDDGEFHHIEIRLPHNKSD